MALNSPADLFNYELSSMHDAERKSSELIGEMIAQVGDGDLSQLLRMQQQETQQKLMNLDQCFQALGTQRQEIPCAAVDGMRADLKQFVGQQPSPQVMELHSLGAAMKLTHFGIASYKGLVDKAMLMGETQCAQMLQTNLVQKEENAGKLERLSHEMSERVMAAT
jgi:ferritin-like metal-binding protein YciE